MISNMLLIAIWANKGTCWTPWQRGMACIDLSSAHPLTFFASFPTQPELAVEQMINHFQHISLRFRKAKVEVYPILICPVAANLKTRTAAGHNVPRLLSAK